MRLIICDMSGIASNRGVNNVELLKTLDGLDNFVCTFCTGKGYHGGFQTLKDVNLKVPFICENGAVIVDKNGRVLFNDKMDPNKVRDLILSLSKMDFEFLAYVDLKTHKYKFLKGNKPLSEDLSQPWFYSEEIYLDVNKFLENINLHDVCRITTRGLEITSYDKLKEEFHIVISENEFHSICGKSVNKGFGVKKLAKIININIRDVVVIGNDLNDIDMFKTNCGYKIATGEKLPPEELMKYADIYVPLKNLPKFLKNIDKFIGTCYTN